MELHTKMDWDLEMLKERIQWELEELQAQLLSSTNITNHEVCDNVGELLQHQPYTLLAFLSPQISLLGNPNLEPSKERNLGNLSSNLANLLQC